MDNRIYVLFVDEPSSGADAIDRILAGRADQFRSQRVEDVDTALARIGGGGIDIILLRLQPERSETEPLERFQMLHAEASTVPIVVVCDSADEGLAERALKKGAAAYLIRESAEVDLLQILVSTVEKSGRQSAANNTVLRPAKRGRVLAFMGAKGGVGNTTVALNVASVLAANHSVIFVELDPAFGTLQHFCQLPRSAPDMGRLLNVDRSSLTPSGVEACLWPYKISPGLRILFGPRNLENAKEVNPEDASGLLSVLKTLADYVVADLPVSLSQPNKAVLETADLLTLVVERDAIAVQSAKRILQALDHWIAGTVAKGTVIVNRTALVSPMPIPEIEAVLSAPVFAAIPPAPDLCAAAQRASAPLVMFDAESLAAICLRDLARLISEDFPAARRQEPANAKQRVSHRTPSIL